METTLALQIISCLNHLARINSFLWNSYSYLSFRPIENDDREGFQVKVKFSSNFEKTSRCHFTEMKNIVWFKTKINLCLLLCGCMPKLNLDFQHFQHWKGLQELEPSSVIGAGTAVFTPNVDFDQLKYNSGYHTPFNFIQLWFCAHLRKFKYTRQSNLAVWNKMVQ